MLISVGCRFVKPQGVDVRIKTLIRDIIYQHQLSDCLFAFDRRIVKHDTILFKCLEIYLSAHSVPVSNSRLLEPAAVLERAQRQYMEFQR